MGKKVTRLYEQFAPEHYTINVSISEDKLNFTGSVSIKGRKTGRPSERITLHAKDLKIDNAKITHIDKKGTENDVELSRTNLQKSFDEVRLHSENSFYPGEYIVYMDFSGEITDNMDGIYPCRFTEDGVDKKLIATQFESHHAREVFPCVDEPEAKATFDVSISHNKDETALGNTPIISEDIKDDAKVTTFDTTPIMSTYLVAFVVGNIEYKEAQSKNGVKIRTYATRDQVQHTEFALDVAVKAMDFYEDYYKIPFPLGKCDFIALPDFASGAMENWGLITFREQTLLMDPEHTSLSTKQYVAIVVCHELTHQWFGNLVTMRWWTDLWLNEGFASWMEYLAVNDQFPEWNLWTQFAVDEQQAAMKADALEHTHPIEVPVNHPDEIRSIFDMISYQKGASMIHMLHDYLGPKPFRDGLRHYLKTHAYKNTDTVDLWQALEDVTKKPVKDFMGKWTSQPGFPLVEVAHKNNYIEISQSRFVTNPESDARNDDTLWPVPLLVNGLNETLLTKSRKIQLEKSIDPPTKINVGQNGFYRVRYSRDMQQKQIEELKAGNIPSVDRMGLLADSFEATKAGYQPVTDFLELLEHYQDEDTLSVWEIIAGSIATIRSILSQSDRDDTLRDAMKPYILNLVAKQLEKLEWEEKKNEPHLDTLLRPIIIGLAAAADEESVLSKIQLSYKERLIGGSVDPNLRGIIYSNVARRGGRQQYDEMLKLYEETTSSDEKLSLTAGLTSFEQADIHADVLDLIKSDTVRTQDNGYWIAYSFMNRHGRHATWEWVKDNWTWLNDVMGTDLSFSRLPVYAARSFAAEKLIKDYKSFFSGKITPTIERSYNQGLEIAQTNAAWRERDDANALKYFS